MKPTASFDALALAQAVALMLALAAPQAFAQPAPGSGPRTAQPGTAPLPISPTVMRAL